MPNEQDNILMKKCTKCDIVSPATEAYFYRDIRNKSGLYACCKVCSGAYRLAHSEKQRQYNRVYRKDHFDVLRQKEKAWREANKESLHQKKQQYSMENRERLNIAARLYASTHPEQRQANEQRRRARKNGAAINDFTHSQWLAMQSHYDHRCVYCGKRRKGKLTQDHITPLSKGGNHTASNIVPACRSCNAKKLVGPPLVPVQPLLFAL